MPGFSYPPLLANRSNPRQDPQVTRSDHATLQTLDLPGGFLPWLTSIWRSLRRLAPAVAPTKEEEALLHLVAYAVSHFGDAVLSASDVDDLDDRLDDLLEEPGIFHWNVLATRRARPLLRDDPTPADDFTATATPVLGEGQARALQLAAPLLDAYLQTQRRVMASVSAEDVEEAMRDLEAVGPGFLTSPEVAPEIADSLAGGLKAGLCLFAIARALSEETRIEPWLARALVDRLVAGVRSHLRLLAAFPGADVPESVLPPEGRLDLDAIHQRHTRARAQASRSYDAARVRLLRDA